MEVNNFNLIKNFIDGCGENEFYMLNIFQRSKDSDANNKNKPKTIKTYYVSSVEYLERKMPEIMHFCEYFNARAYINLNKKSWEQINFKSLKILVENMEKKNYKKLLSIVDSACGQTGACDGNKSWIVDVDTKDMNEVNKIIDSVCKCPPYYEDAVITTIPTVHGYHIITKPFNLKDFNLLYQTKIDIHDNNPTLLYFKDNN